VVFNPLIAGLFRASDCSGNPFCGTQKDWSGKRGFCVSRKNAPKFSEINNSENLIKI
jgi:hypothetical protein